MGMFATAVLALALSVRPDGYVFIKGHETYIEDRSLDLNRIDSLRGTYGPDFFYFRSSGAEYVIIDPAVLKQINALLDPQRELGRKQADLGDKQAAIGGKQAELGARQAALGAAQASADSKTQAHLSADQEELSRRQEALGRQQQVLGDLQSDLGEKQEVMNREIREKIGSLTKEWIRSGVAKPLRGVRP